MVERGVLDSAKEGGITGAFAGFAIGSARSFIYGREYAGAPVTKASKAPQLPATSMISKVSTLRPTVSPVPNLNNSSWPPRHWVLGRSNPLHSLLRRLLTE